ncbi:retinoic acid receptor RXR-alpha-B-like [Mya arenaria]|uniref:retinoic acid receptor RXR-alpha-B-like n=1 Tax=Mya arenaria TaxID=6604 RepID=UPI0022E9350E|nr:retinoic acid receptor RXR-alpha-B-like [Mya arenaria]XP_052804895.1 retinoic acid receptor RXR-alpha-B-like [Mya arenaria]
MTSPAETQLSPAGSHMSVSDASPASHYTTFSLSPGDLNHHSIKPKMSPIGSESGDQLYEMTDDAGMSPPIVRGPEDEAIIDNMVYQVCVICGDRGSGYHYSVLSCEGCKGFFKRSVQKNLQYTCKGNGTCVVNKATRNNCQFCRFHKCMQLGMQREAVREDRSPGGKQRVKRMKVEGEGEATQNVSTPSKSLEPEHAEIINIIISSNPDKIPTRDESNKGKEISVQELMEYGYMELKYIIEWAKKVPDFRLFGMDDQMALLKSAFMELSVFRMSYRSLPYVDSLFFAEGVILHRSLCETMGWGQELVQATLEFSCRLRQLNCDKVEFAMMSAIVLTYPDAIGLVDKMKVTKIQTKFLDVLRRYVTVQYPTDRGRFGKLLLRLPTLRTLSAKAAERFLSLTLDGVLPINELVQEMMC